MEVEKIGRRHYIRNAPFEFKDMLRRAGCKWDADERAWWTSKKDLAAQLVTKISENRKQQNEAPGMEAQVVGKAYYKGKTYPVLWEGMTKRGTQAYKLAFRDGSKTFWADKVDAYTPYRKPMTLAVLAKFAEDAHKAASGELEGEIKVCWECGCQFDRRIARLNQGDWEAGHCGC